MASITLSPEHIESTSDETDSGDGYWVYLKPGFKWAGDPVGNVHGIHEDSQALCYEEAVTFCYCPFCVMGLETFKREN